MKKRLEKKNKIENVREETLDNVNQYIAFGS